MNDGGRNSQGALLDEIRRLLMPWGFGMLLPIPMLAASAHCGAADVTTMYLGLGAAWIAAEAFAPGEEPLSLSAWRMRMAALVLCLATNAVVFWLFGVAAGVQSNIPLPLLATFGVAPSLGLVPWFTLRLRQRYGAIVLSGLTVGAIKIAACVVARIVYGPDFLAQGYISADWNTAKLMISLVWIGTLLVSSAALLACARRFGTRTGI